MVSQIVIWNWRDITLQRSTKPTLIFLNAGSWYEFVVLEIKLTMINITKSYKYPYNYHNYGAHGVLFCETNKRENTKLATRIEIKI